MPTPAVHETEVLYRQVGENRSPIYFDPNRAPPVHRTVFIPTRKDTDGLSLIRSRFRTDIWAAYRLEQPTKRFRLARLQALSLRQLANDLGFQSLVFLATADGLDDQHGEPWAHCVVTNINRTDYDSDSDVKKRIKEWALGVANLITNDHVIGPFREPTEEDEYRPPNDQ